MIFHSYRLLTLTTLPMFLNKRNIINVSISRAKDYLFIVMPDDDTENIHNLRLVKRVEQLVKNSEDFSESFTHDLEFQMFGNRTYLENNSFSTGHQSVNVYGLPEKRYEIRSEDAAVDVQIHRNIKIDTLVLANHTNTEKDGIESNVTAQTTIKSENIVFSPRYGEGKIINRWNNKGSVYIEVQFKNKKTSYVEEVAFKTKSLVRK